jgi:hypothetical protein
MIASTHLISKFFFRIEFDVHLTAKLAFCASKDRNEIDRCDFTHNEKINVTLPYFLAAGDRTVDCGPAYPFAESP